MGFFETIHQLPDPHYTTVEDEDSSNFEENPSQTTRTILDILGIPVAVSGSQTEYNLSPETDSTDWSWDNIYPKQSQGQSSLTAEANITPNFNVEGSVDSNTGWSAGANYEKGPFQSRATLEKDRATLKAALRGNLGEIRGGLIKEGDADTRTVGASFRVPNTPISFSVDQSKYKNPYGQEKVTEGQGIFSLQKKGQIAAFFNKNPYQTVIGADAGVNLPKNWTASGSMLRTDPVDGEPFWNAEGQLTKTFKDKTIATLIATHGPIESAKILLRITKPLN